MVKTTTSRTSYFYDEKRFQQRQEELNRLESNVWSLAVACFSAGACIGMLTSLLFR